VKAPFAAFRHLTAGSYRPTAPFPTPSAVYGLLLNVAGIESRFDDGKSPVTLTRTGLPALELALGAVSMPEVHSLYQQLHNYPVGTTGRERAPDCKGNKYNIQPIRRELLSGVDLRLDVRGDSPTIERIRCVLRGEPPVPGHVRYGLPFLGDNNLLLDVLREEEDPGTPARWLVPASQDLPHGTLRMRLTISIDRADMTRTRSGIFTIDPDHTATPPDAAWVRVGMS